MPERSGGELPAFLRALQYIYTDPELDKAVFDLLENRLFLSSEHRRSGRPGKSLWEILVLGVIRLTLMLTMTVLSTRPNSNNPPA